MTEKHKFYVLIGMVCIAAVVAYLRFLRPTAADRRPLAAVTESRAAPFSAGIVQHHATLTGIDNTMPQSLPSQQISRNIFKPAAPLPASIVYKSAAPRKVVQADMTLSGTIIGSHAPLAIINNKFMRQGQQLGKYTILRITPDKVYLKAGDEQFILNTINVAETITP